MRASTFIELATLAALSGCAKVTKEQGTKAFYRELHLHFNNLNNEAQFRKDAVAAYELVYAALGA